MISIIIPIYNVEKYLKRCLDSILNQTFTDYELILVDDGSIDSSGDICDEYAQHDSRISVIHKSNGGISSARNEGLKKAQGDYVQFIDSDDVVHPSMLQVLFESLISGDYEFSMIRGLQVPEDYPIELMENFSKSFSYKVMTCESCMKGLYGFGNKKINYLVTWNKLYKKDLLDGIFFNETASEDTEFNNRVYLRVKNAIAIDAVLYFWVQHPTSFTHTEFSQKNIFRINSYLLCLGEIPKEKPSYRAMCLRALYTVILHTRQNSRGTSFYDEACRIAHNAYLQTKDELIRSELNWFSKYGLLYFYRFPRSYEFMIRVMNLMH